jgi:hypothetical protein
MTSFPVDTLEIPQAQQVTVMEDALIIGLSDGRTYFCSAGLASSTSTRVFSRAK